VIGYQENAVNRIAQRALLKLQIVLVAITMAVLPLSALAALNGYMTAKGETQGKINGSVTQAGREGSMKVEEFSHSVSQSIDSASGLPSGKRQHRPIRVTKEIDKASPLLMNAFTNNEILTEVRIDFWQPSSSGQEIQFYTVELVNARITNISQHQGSTGEFVEVEPAEMISLVYDKITWTWQDGGITSEDDW